MATHPYLLEHEILKTLYTVVSFGIRGEGKFGGKTTPVFKRDYEYSSLHFGTLVDILNSPEKYTQDKMPVGEIGWLKNHSASIEDVLLEKEMKYTWVEVNDALEVLAANNHIKENQVEINIYSDNMKRIVYLKNEGALAYRNNFYLKEAGKELSLERGYLIQEKELWLKRNFWRVEMAKYIMGGIIGALIALGVKQIGKSPVSTIENTTPMPRDTVDTPKTVSSSPSITNTDTSFKQAIDTP